MTATIHRHHHRTWGLGTTDRPDNWRDDAQCVNYPPDWWDLIGNTLTQQNQQAIRICHTCPTQTECDQLAHDTNAVGVIMAAQPRFGLTTTNWTHHTCAHCHRQFTRPEQRPHQYCTPLCRHRAQAAHRPQPVDQPVDNT